MTKKVLILSEDGENHFQYSADSFINILNAAAYLTDAHLSFSEVGICADQLAVRGFTCFKAEGVNVFALAFKSCRKLQISGFTMLEAGCRSDSDIKQLKAYMSANGARCLSDS